MTQQDLEAIGFAFIYIGIGAGAALIALLIHIFLMIQNYITLKWIPFLLVIVIQITSVLIGVKYIGDYYIYIKGIAFLSFIFAPVINNGLLLITVIFSTITAVGFYWLFGRLIWNFTRGKWPYLK